MIDVEHDATCDEDFTIEDDHEQITRNIKNNSEWMLNHLVEFRRFDWCYNLSLFSDSLKATGKHLIEEDLFVKSKKQGRRCLHAAGMLEKIANDNLIADCDTGWRRRLENTEMEFVEVPGTDYMRLEWKYNYTNAMGMDPDEYDSKMTKLSVGKENKIKEGLITDTFELIRKNFQRWWS